jgi:hypothetical protein
MLDDDGAHRDDDVAVSAVLLSLRECGSEAHATASYARHMRTRADGVTMTTAA